MELKFTAGDQLGVVHEILVTRLAIEQGALDVGLLRTIAASADGERSAIVQLEHRLVEERAAYGVSSLPGADGIEAQRTEDVPGRHLPAVLVAVEPSGCGVVLLPEDAADHGLRLPRLVGKGVEIGQVMARLVPMRILPDQA